MEGDWKLGPGHMNSLDEQRKLASADHAWWRGTRRSLRAALPLAGLRTRSHDDARFYDATESLSSASMAAQAGSRSSRSI